MKVIGVLDSYDSLNNCLKAADRYIIEYLNRYNGKYVKDISWITAEDINKPDYVIETDALYHIPNLVRAGQVRKLQGVANYIVIDTGYLMRGNGGVRKKNPQRKYCRRAVLNNVQNVNTMSREEIIERYKSEYKGKDVSSYLDERFKFFTWQSYSKFKLDTAPRGNKILLVPPSQRSCEHYGIDLQDWLDTTIDQINTYWTKTPKAEIEIREKGPRRDRVDYSFMDQLHEGHYWCAVTFNSIAAVESAMCNIPCITTLPESCASCISEHDIKNINDPYLAHTDKIKEHFYYLTQCQFTADELASDHLYRMLNAVQKADLKI